MLNQIVTGDRRGWHFAKREFIAFSRSCCVELFSFSLLRQKRLDRRAPRLTGLGFGLLGGLGGYSLIDLEESHLQLSEKVEEQGVFLGG